MDNDAVHAISSKIIKKKVKKSVDFCISLLYNNSMKMKKELKIFDIDETLFETTAKIQVIKDGKVVKTLSNQEYNTNILNDGETYDYSEFRDSQKFFDESIPLLKIIETAKQEIDNTNNVVKIVTARADFDNKDIFLDTFKKHGIDIDKVHVHRVGNMKDNVRAAEKKKMVIREMISNLNCGKVTLFDDSIENLEAFLNLSKEFVGVGFDAKLAYEGELTTFELGSDNL